jgi:hypothetical protein
MNRRGFIQSILGAVGAAAAAPLLAQAELLLPAEAPIELGSELGFVEHIMPCVYRNGRYGSWLYVATVGSAAEGQQWDWAEMYDDDPSANAETLAKARRMAKKAFDRIKARA